VSKSDTAFVLVVSLCILAAFLFGGDPDITDAVAHRIMDCSERTPNADPR
jgi:hypothetical protein